jgi:hypothetical protein
MHDDKWSELRKHLPTLIVSQSGGAAPYQASGLIQGWEFYFRSRHSRTTLSVGRPDVQTRSVPVRQSPLWSSELPYVDIYNDEGFAAVLPQMVKTLHRADFLFYFPTRNVNFEVDRWSNIKSITVVDDDKTSKICVEGQSPEDAFRKLIEPSAMFLGPSSYASWFDRLLELDPDPEPLNEDVRVFPEEEPEWIVK